MVFNIFVILLVLLIAYWHFVQGFFSATISAIIAILAAVMAVSYHENVVNLLLKGKMADQAHALVLCILFAVVYIVLRTLFDKAIPGGVRTPSTVDHIGAALMGLVAGSFTVGIFAIAVQMLPFDPKLSWMGYSRYELLEDNPNAVVPRVGQQSLDTHIDGELKAPLFTPAPEDPSLAADDPAKPHGLWIPVDDIVMDTCYYLSKGMGPLGGPLSGDRPLASIHPDYLHEIFGERLGIQVGAQRVALKLGTDEPIEVEDVFKVDSLPAVDGQLVDLRPRGYQPPYKVPSLPSGEVQFTDPQKKGYKTLPYAKEMKSAPGQILLVLRVKVNSSATDTKDENGIFKFSTGSVRLVGQTTDGVYKDYHPIGTLEDGKTLLLNKPDDFLFVQGDDAFDAVFMVDSSLLAGDKLADGVFINVKRFGYDDLSGHDVKKTIKPDKQVRVMRSKTLTDVLANLKIPVNTKSESTP